MTWRKALQKVLDDWDQRAIVTSPDIDGLASAALVSAATGAKLAGVYTLSNILLFDGATREQARDALWLDHDISHPGVRCIGQHLVNHLGTDTLRRRHSPSFNPNQHFGQHYHNSFAGAMKPTRDKYPFATCHFLLHALDLEEPAPGTPAFALLAHADGSWAAAIDYRPNARQWSDFMFGKRSTLLETLSSGAYATPTKRGVHAAVVQHLAALGLPAKGSRERESRHVPPEWKPFEGHQTIRFKHDMDREAWLERFSAAARYVVSTLGLKLPMPERVTFHARCRTGSVSPSEIDNRMFDDWLDRKDVFSHAFKSRSVLSYTVNPVL